MAVEPADDQIRVREGHAVWREIEGETVLLDLESSVYVGINGVGSLLWHQMVAGTTRRALIDLVVASYDVARAQAEVDVGRFISQCQERNLLTS